ncbi:hypothetical protein ACHAXR_004426 [Thalassiosira sp. AJA248-18]
MMFYSSWAVFSIGVVIAAASFASAATTNHGVSFAANSLRKRTIFSSSSPSKRGTLTPPQTLLFQSLSDNHDDVFLLSLDGTLASTSRARSWMAVCVALKVWPPLQSNMMELGIDPNVFDWECNKDVGYNSERDDSYEWLIQKLSALSSITQHGNSLDAMLGCESVFLARTLLEEQLLDGGRSNGRGGKYGGKFHPSSTSEDTGDRSKVGSRPLTVGELYANWSELSDVMRMKYPFVEESPDGKLKRQDPLPKIRQYLTKLFSRQSGLQSNFLPSWQSLAYDILFDYQSISSQSNDKGINLRQNTMLLLGHDAQIPWALQSLSLLGCAVDVESDMETAQNMYLDSNMESNDLNMKVIVTTSDKAWARLSRHKGKDGNTESDIDDDRPSLLLVIPDTQKEECHSNMIEKIVTDIVSNSERDSNKIFVIHSSLEVLKQCKTFLGDDAPILSQGLRQCILPNTAVTLFLPEWADNVHPTQQNDGEMDPWLNLVSEEQLLELISAQITARPLA